MTRMVQFNSPFLLGFDEMERLLEQVAKGSDGYPPYNVEEVTRIEGETPRRALRITLAVAGFARDELSVTVEDNQLVIRGRKREDEGRVYLYRGIAARQFQRAFVLAEGIDVGEARLDNGLLSIDLIRPEPSRLVRQIEIEGGVSSAPAT